MPRLDRQLILAKARAFACLSATDSPVQTFDDFKLANAVVNLLNQRIYHVDLATAVQPIRPYCCGFKPDGSQTLFIPAWARAGVRYIKPSTDLKKLDPTDWYRRWWEIYVAMEPREPGAATEAEREEDAIFEGHFHLLGLDEEFLRAQIAKGWLVVDRLQIRKIKETDGWTF